MNQESFEPSGPLPSPGHGSQDYTTWEEQASDHPSGETRSRQAEIPARVLSPGERLLDRYVIRSRIGAGGMGAVYKALEKVSGLEVAIKLLPPSSTATPAQVAALQKNFILVSQLRHPGIVELELLEQVPETGEYFLVMEYVPGECDLDQYRRRFTREIIPWEQILTLALPLAEALDYAHSQQVVHRDIKPGNLMVTPSGTIKITDFGLAGSTAAGAETPLKGGTRAYMSPEQWEGHPVDGRSDQWSLAVLLYQLATGSLPFPARDATELGVQIKHAEPSPVSWWPAARFIALARSLAKDPSARYPTVRDLVVALRAAEEGAPAAGVSPGPSVPPASAGDEPDPTADTTSFLEVSPSPSPVPPARSRPRLSGAQLGAGAAILVVFAGVFLTWREYRRVSTLRKKAEIAAQVRQAAEDTAAREKQAAEERKEQRLREEAAWRKSELARLLAEAGSHLAANRYDLAIATLTVARKLESENAELKKMLQEAERKRRLKIGEEKKLSTYQFWFDAGRKAFRTRRYQAALGAFHRALGFRDTEEVRWQINEIYFRRCRSSGADQESRQVWTEAIACYERALGYRNDPALAARIRDLQDLISRQAELRSRQARCRSWMGKGEQEDQAGRPGRAAYCFLQARGLAEEPQHAGLEARARACRDRARQAASRRQTLSLLEQARAASGTADWPRALKLAQEVLARDPGQREAGEIARKAEHEILTPARFVNTVGLTLVLLPAGGFTMGSTGNLVNAAEKPSHRVTLPDPFYLCRTEVAQAAYRQVMGNNPSARQGDNLPVEMVTWEEATIFCRKLSLLEKREYRLPTEAEWEYACRAGTTTLYHFSEDPDRLEQFAWFDQNAEKQSHEVGKKEPNPWGLLDMLGNVREWCRDWYGEQYYANSPATDPTGPTNGSDRVHRGGCWYYSARVATSTDRDKLPPTSRSPWLGFRIVCQTANTATR